MKLVLLMTKRMLIVNSAYEINLNPKYDRH